MIEFSSNAEEFQRVMRQWLLNSTQELSKAINRRMFYLLLRAYVLTPPQNLDAERRKIRAYMNVEPEGRRFDRKTGKKVSKSRALRRVNLITQARNAKSGQKGLYGEAMKKASASVFRKAVGSVGYLKAPFVVALKQINGHFTQWGGKTSKKGRDVSPNSALVQIAGEYGVTMAAGNVGIMRGVRANCQAARPGVDPTAFASMKLGTTSDIGRIESIANPAMQRAMDDELEEMKRHLADVIDDAADRACLTSPHGKAG